MSGREKIWAYNKVVWVRLPDDIEDEEEPDDLWPDLMLALECLTPKQRFVIERRYGLVCEPLEFADIGYLMGISAPAVKQLETRAIEKMQGWVKRDS